MFNLIKKYWYKNITLQIKYFTIIFSHLRDKKVKGFERSQFR